jgi:hypothetical protein
VLAFAAGVFLVTLAGEGLYHVIGTPGCQSTPTSPVRCSEESGWWALVLGGGFFGAVTALRAARQGVVRRMLLGALLLGLGLAPLWALADDRTDAGGWAAAGAISTLLGIAILAGLAAAALRAVREPDAMGHVADPTGPRTPPRPPSMADPTPSPETRSPAIPTTPSSPPGIPSSPPPTVPSSPSPAPQTPAVEISGGEDPFGREAGDTADPFGRED